MTRVLILGGGMIGSAVTVDLARDATFEVTVADVSPGRLAAIASRTSVIIRRTPQSSVLVQSAQGT